MAPLSARMPQEIVAPSNAGPAAVRAAGAANAVCADKLAVCADVEQQRRLCDLFKRGGGQAGDRIRADKPADYGPDQRDGLRMNPQIDIRCGPNLTFESTRRVRRAHKLL